MVARGEVTLIVAAAGSKVGLLEGGVFSAIVAAVLLTTLVTPPMLRLAFTRLKPKAQLPVVEPVVKNEEQ